MCPPAASRQMCHSPLEAALQEDPAVLVGRRQSLEVVHQAASTISAAVRLRCLVRWGAGWGSCGQKVVGGIEHAEMDGDKGNDGGVCRVYCAFAELDVEFEEGCKGDEDVEGPHGGLRGTLQENVISVCPGACQVHLSDLFEWPLHSE
jgi:hypothetical protein